MIRVGMIGFSEGNGHPYSFSAILNGYQADRFADCGWPGIQDYLARRDPSEFGIPGMRVTHAWMPDFGMTRALCDACAIDRAARDVTELVGNVDAVIIARDDADSHWPLAEPFLTRGVPVFIDKPLAPSVEVLRRFVPYLEAGTLMSCAGMRFATELDGPRAELASYGTLKLVRAAVVLDWMRYGIHALDAILGVTGSRGLAVTPHRAGHQSVAIETCDGPLLLIDALGTVPKTFRFDFIGSERATSHEVTDNFGMFRRLLWHFAAMVRTGEPPVPAAQALEPLRILLAGREALERGVRVELQDGLP